MLSALIVRVTVLTRKVNLLQIQQQTKEPVTNPMIFQNTLPKMQFPIFTRENPKIWRDKCEKYFRISMYLSTGGSSRP
jgi:hypothetical protein